MKLPQADSTSCSCTSCVYKLYESQRPSLRLLKNENRTESLCLRKRIALNERKSVRSKAVYDEVKKGLLSTSSSTKHEKAYAIPTENIDQDSDVIERSCAILELVDLVDKGVALGPRRLMKCCSCCSYNSICIHKDHTKTHARLRHGRNVNSTLRHQKVYINMNGVANSKSFVNGEHKKRFKSKYIKSTPCMCLCKMNDKMKHETNKKMNIEIQSEISSSSFELLNDKHNYKSSRSHKRKCMNAKKIRHSKSYLRYYRYQQEYSKNFRKRNGEYSIDNIKALMAKKVRNERQSVQNTNSKFPFVFDYKPIEHNLKKYHSLLFHSYAKLNVNKINLPVNLVKPSMESRSSILKRFQFDYLNPFKSHDFCTMNAQMHKISVPRPYEYELGVCVPDKCDSNKFIKLINQRLKTTTVIPDTLRISPVSSGIERKFQTDLQNRSHKKKTPKSDPNTIEKRHRKTYRKLDYYEYDSDVCLPGQCDPYDLKKRHRRKEIDNGMKYVIEQQRFNAVSSPHRQAARTSSSTSFNTEFFKDKRTCISEVPVTKKYEPVLIKPIKQQAFPKGVISNKAICAKEISLRSSRFHGYGPKTESKYSGIGSILKRCFCTLKLQKKVPKEQPVKKHKIDMGVRIKEIYAELEPYECEPSVYVPGQRDPNVCEKGVRKRNMKYLGTDALLFPNPEYTDNDVQSDKVNQQRNKKALANEPKLVKNKQCQAVEIGSYFVFNKVFSEDEVNEPKIKIKKKYEPKYSNDAIKDNKSRRTTNKGFHDNEHKRPNHRLMVGPKMKSRRLSARRTFQLQNKRHSKAKALSFLGMELEKPPGEIHNIESKCKYESRLALCDHENLINEVRNRNPVDLKNHYNYNFSKNFYEVNNSDKIRLSILNKTDLFQRQEPILKSLIKNNKISSIAHFFQRIVSFKKLNMLQLQSRSKTKTELKIPRVTCGKISDAKLNTREIKMKTYNNGINTSRKIMSRPKCSKNRSSYQTNRSDEMKTIFPYIPSKYQHNVSRTLLVQNSMKIKAKPCPIRETFSCNLNLMIKRDENKKILTSKKKSRDKENKSNNKNKSHNIKIIKRSLSTIFKVRHIFHRFTKLFPKSPNQEKEETLLKNMINYKSDFYKRRKTKIRRNVAQISDVMKCSNSDRRPTNHKVSSIPKKLKSVGVNRVSAESKTLITRQAFVRNEEIKKYCHNHNQSEDTGQRLMNSALIYDNNRSNINDKYLGTYSPVQSTIQKQIIDATPKDTPYYFMDNKVVQFALFSPQNKKIKECNPVFCQVQDNVCVCTKDNITQTRTKKANKNIHKKILKGDVKIIKDANNIIDSKKNKDTKKNKTTEKINDDKKNKNMKINKVSEISKIAKKNRDTKKNKEKQADNEERCTAKKPCLCCKGAKPNKAVNYDGTKGKSKKKALSIEKCVKECKTVGVDKRGKLKIKPILKIKPVKIKPLFVMKLQSKNLNVLNRDEVLYEVKRNLNAAGKNVTPEMIAQLHGKSCSCCICQSVRRPHTRTHFRKACLDRLLYRIKPCTCGSEPCAVMSFETQTKARKHKEKLKKRKSCVCGSQICEEERLKLDIENQLISKGKGKELRKQLKTESQIKKARAIEKAKRKREEKDYEARTKQYKQEDELRRKIRLKEDKIADKQVEKFRRSSDTVLVAESVIDIIKCAINAVTGTLRCMWRAIWDPKHTYRSIKLVKKDPERVLVNAKDVLVSSGTLSTAKRVGRRVQSMQFVQNIVAKLETHPATRFAMHSCDKDPKKRMAMRRARRREPMDFQCSLFMASLRKRPWLCVYYKCPWFYPHCISLLNVWRQFTDVILFLLAVFVWSPCILAMELCRACMCCTMCTA